MRKCPSAAAAGFLMENTNADSAGLKVRMWRGRGPDASGRHLHGSE